MGTPFRRAAAALITSALVGGGLAACEDPKYDKMPELPFAAYADAASTPQRDSVYPAYGTTEIDARHYGLDLTWDGTRLSGTETLTFRALKKADSFVLDLGAPLEIGKAELDGNKVTTTRDGDKLTVRGAVDGDHVLTLEYAGTPAGVRAPSDRGSLDELGWVAAKDGTVSTIQQPYGAFTWYAVNETPSDKAFHDVTLRVPSTWVGISNGTLSSRTTDDGQTVTKWHGSAPAAPSAMTVAIGDYESAEAKTATGLPVLTWTERGDTISQESMKTLPGLVDWLVARLGDYPFEAVGAVVVPGMAGSDTQETITVGTGPSTRTEVALVNQLAHQWWGNAVTPADWRDLWIAEGVPFLLADGSWRVDREDVGWADVVAGWRGADALNRKASGPPAGFEPKNFGPASVDYGSALMWEELRETIGDKAFAKPLLGLPTKFGGESVTRADVIDWASLESGLDLELFAGAWLDGEQTPATGFLRN
jgi:hypothetical protein